MMEKAAGTAIMAAFVAVFLLCFACLVACEIAAGLVSWFRGTPASVLKRAQ